MDFVCSYFAAIIAYLQWMFASIDDECTPLNENGLNFHKNDEQMNFQLVLLWRQ